MASHAAAVVFDALPIADLSRIVRSRLPSACRKERIPMDGDNAPSSAAPASPSQSGGSQLGAEQIEAMLRQGGVGGSPGSAPASNAPRVGDDIELLLGHAERALASAQNPSASSLPPGVNPFKFDDFSGAPPSTEAATIELIRDVELDLKIELGRTHMYLEDVLKLRKGSVVPLDKLAGDPVDIYVNGRLIARGEVLVLNDNFCVRVAELVSGEPAAAA